MHRIIMFFANISSISFWLKGTETTWYVYGITVFYLLFPFLYMFSMRNSRRNKLLLMTGMFGLAVAAAYLPLLNHSLIVWARLPIFTMGVFSGCDSDHLPKIHNWELVILTVVLIILGFLISQSEISDSVSIPKIYRFLLYFPMTLSVSVLISVVSIKHRPFQDIGKLSLEIYLAHVTLLHLLKYYGFIEKVGYWLYVILPVISVIIGCFVKRFEELLQRRQFN